MNTPTLGMCPATENLNQITWELPIPSFTNYLFKDNDRTRDLAACNNLRWIVSPVSIASGIILKRTQWRPMLVMALAFGLFQALMPFIGWMFAKTFSHLIESIDHWIAFAILAFLGGRMILESFKDEDCRQTFNPASPKVVFTMAIATSIDALAIGISFALLGINNYTDILSPILIIGFVSFVMSLIGLYFGIKCGCGCARKLKAELWGGIILVAIGLKILIEHLFLQ